MVPGDTDPTAYNATAKVKVLPAALLSKFTTVHLTHNTLAAESHLYVGVDLKSSHNGAMIGRPVAFADKLLVGSPVAEIGGGFPAAEVVRRIKPLVETQNEG